MRTVNWTSVSTLLPAFSVARPRRTKPRQLQLTPILQLGNTLQLESKTQSCTIHPHWFELELEASVGRFVLPRVTAQAILSFYPDTAVVIEFTNGLLPNSGSNTSTPVSNLYCG